MTINNGIIEYLNQYLAIEKPGFAVLLKGKWGCGKTWFIRDYIKKYNQDFVKLDATYKNRFLNISLNGITKVESIDRRIFFALHKKLDNEYTELISHLASGFLTFTSVDSLVQHFTLNDFIHDVKNKVVVFDDLERCCLPIIETLGYISDFVERLGINVIIISNEDEIEEIERSSGDEERRQKWGFIREKVIGRKFKVEHDITTIVPSLIDSLSSDLLKEKLQSKIQLIVDIFKKSESDNIRIFKHALFDFELLWRKFTDEQKSNDEIIIVMLTIFLCLKFDIEKNHIKAKDISGIKYAQINMMLRNSNKKEENPHQKIEETFERYPFPELKKIIRASDFWVQYFENGYTTKELLQASIHDMGLVSLEFPPSAKLLEWYNLDTEQELNSLITQTEEQLSGNLITSPLELLSLSGVYIHLIKNKLLDRELPEIISKIKGTINNLNVENKLEYVDLNGTDDSRLTWYGYLFYSKDDEEFKEIFDYLKKLMNEKEINNILSVAQEIPSLVIYDFNKFKDILTNSYLKYPILSHVDVKKFVDNLIAIPNKEKINPFYVLKKRYNFVDVYKELYNEIQFIEGIWKLLLEYTQNYNTICSTQIDFAVKKYLENIIKLLKKDHVQASTDNNENQ